MLQNIRDNAQGTMAKVIIAIIIIPFALFGIEGLFGSGGADEVATINGEEVSELELRQAIELQRRRVAAQMGDDINYDLLEEDRLRQPALDTLIDQRVLLQAAGNADMLIPDAVLDQYITRSEDFQEDGKFSPQKYEILLRSNGFTPKYYKQLVRSELLVQQLASAYTQGGFLTPAEQGIIASLMYQTRDIRYLTLPMQQYSEAITVGEDEIADYYSSHEDQFYSEESVAINYIEVKKSDFFKDVTEQQIETVYEREVAEFVANEERRVAHILVKAGDVRSDEEALAKAQKLRERVMAGEPFAEVAKAESEDLGTRMDGGDLGFASPDSFPDSFARELLSLEPGAVSEPVKTDSGYHIIKLIELRGNTPPTLEERRSAIRVALQNQSAEADFVAKTEALADMSFNAADLAAPAEKLGLEVKTSAYFSRQSGQGIAENDKLRALAFSPEVLVDGHNSELLELSADHMVVLRVKDHKPAALRTLDEVRGDIVQLVRREKAAEAIALDQQAILAEIRAGRSIEEVAKAHSLQWTAKPRSKRSGGGVQPQILQKAFALPRPAAEQRSVDSLALFNGDVVIMEVSNVRDGKPADMSDMEKNAMLRYLSSNEGQELFIMYQKALRDRADIEIL